MSVTRMRPSAPHDIPIMAARTTTTRTKATPTRTKQVINPPELQTHNHPAGKEHTSNWQIGEGGAQEGLNDDGLTLDGEGWAP